MAAIERKSWLAVVQTGDELHDQESEVVTIEYRDGNVSMIETTDGRRITLLEPAGDESKAQKAAA